MKKPLFRKTILSFLISFFFSIPLFIQAAPIILLEDYSKLGGAEKFIRDIKDGISTNSTDALASYVSLIINLAFSAASVIALFLIISGGFKYISSSFLKKSDGKDEITRAIFGIVFLVLLFFLYKTVNPYLLITKFGQNKLTQNETETNITAPDLNLRKIKIQNYDQYCYYDDTKSDGMFSFDDYGVPKCSVTKEECQAEVKSLKDNKKIKGSTDGEECFFVFGRNNIQKAKDTGENRYCQYYTNNAGGIDRKTPIKGNCYKNIYKCINNSYNCYDIVNKNKSVKNLIEKEYNNNFKKYEKKYKREYVESVLTGGEIYNGKIKKYDNNIYSCNQKILDFENKGSIKNSCTKDIKTDKFYFYIKK